MLFNRIKKKNKVWSRCSWERQTDRQTKRLKSHLKRWYSKERK